MWEKIKKESLTSPARGRGRACFPWVALVVLAGSISAFPDWARAQSPESPCASFHPAR
jgi:hypothetical protein